MIKLENPDGRSNFNDISLESLGCHLIFGEINEDSMKEAVTFLLKANRIFTTGDLTLYVNSPGGSCSDGFALIDMMNSSRLPISTISSGSIMSMGVLIACAGRKGKRIITRNTEVMAHQYAWGHDSVKYHELIALNKAQEHLAYKFIQHFLRHSTMTESQVRDILFGPSDRWLTAQECKKFGLVDHIVDELPDPNTVALPLAESAALDKQSKRQPRAQGERTGRKTKRS